MPLISNRYGKARVRTLRRLRQGQRESVSELSLDVMLEGEFDRAFTAADNAPVVATDTMKNIVHALACEHPAEGTEAFTSRVAEFLLARYSHVSLAEVTALETRWNRIAIDGQPHDHGFTLDGNGQPFAKVVARRDAVAVESGIKGFTLMKTTASGFTGFHQDEYRTLADTEDRILATSMDAGWRWTHAPADYAAANAAALDAMLRVFFGSYSYGVQDSLYRMGEAALGRVPEIAEIRLAMPNKHYLPVNLAPFGIENDGRVFLPTDEPHGQIEAVIGRG
jgi:urate oxidase